MTLIGRSLAFHHPDRRQGLGKKYGPEPAVRTASPRECGLSTVSGQRNMLSEQVLLCRMLCTQDLLVSLMDVWALGPCACAPHPVKGNLSQSLVPAKIPAGT